MLQTKVYEDDSTVADHLLEDNNVVYFVYKKGVAHSRSITKHLCVQHNTSHYFLPACLPACADGSDTFEEIAVTDTSDDGAAAAVDAGKK